MINPTAVQGEAGVLVEAGGTGGGAGGGDFVGDPNGGFAGRVVAEEEELAAGEFSHGA